MAAFNSTVDGLGGEEVNQPNATTQDVIGVNISGTNLYAKTGVTTPTVTATSVNATTVSGAGNAIYGQVLVAQNAYIDVAISGLAYHETSKGALHSVGIGSGTTTFGARILAGSAALGAGSNVWNVFSTAFTQKPTVVATNLTTADKALFIPAGSINAGSFYIEGPTASDEFSFIAVGL